MLETMKLFILNKSALPGRERPRVTAETVQQLLVDRTAAHWGSYERFDGSVRFTHVLPPIVEVQTWNQSATRRWSPLDLVDLHTKSARRIAAWLTSDKTYSSPDIEAEAVVELIMHREPLKAHHLMHEIIRRRPQAKNSFHQTLGRHITQIVLSPSSF